MNKPSVPRLILGLVILVLMAFTTGFVLFQLPNWFGAAPVQSTYGNVLNPTKIIQDFTLSSTTGEDISLDELKGPYTLLAFGYTHCPDVCPLTLTEFKRVKRDIPEELQDNIQFVFISVDGERDTPEFLGRYLQRFDEEFIGLTTTDESTIRAITNDFDVYFEKRVIEGTQADYLIDHTASLFLLNPDGRLIILYPFGTPASNIASDIVNIM